MARRTRKPPIKQEQRREWLKRVEEDGESPPDIAKKDYFDVRTVRKQIEIAKQEREAREARVIILRNAMESHYNDLHKYVVKLISNISRKRETVCPDDKYIEAALRQHIPQSPIWGYLRKRQTLYEKSNEQIKDIRSLIEQEANDKVKLSPLVADGLTMIVSIIKKNLTAQILPWSEGATEQHLIDNLRHENTQDGLVEFRLGVEVIGKTNREYADKYDEIVRQIYAEMESILQKSALYHDFESTRAEIINLDYRLCEELTKIRLKKIVSGHCDYCPW